MAEKLEVESKYDVPVNFAVPDLAGVSGVATVDDPVEHQLDATYYDTPDLRLARRHMTLRRRTGGNDAGWHLKTPAGDRARAEKHVPLSGDDERDSVPAAVADEIRDITGDDALRPVARIRTRRLERPLRDADGSVLALLADDTVSGEPLDRPATLRRWRELEVELVSGKPRILDAIDTKLRKAGARRSSSRSKLARALGDRLPHPSVPGRRNKVTSRRNEVTGRRNTQSDPNGGRPRRGAGAAALAHYLRAQRDAIRSNAEGVRNGDVDAVHDMRVATRRLRSTLRSFRPLLDKSHLPLVDELKWLADKLGAVRDGDVMAKRLSTAIAAVPPASVLGPVAANVAKRLADRKEEDRKTLVEAMDSPRHAALLAALDRLVDGPPATKVTVNKLRRQARRALKRADRRLAAARRARKAKSDRSTPSNNGNALVGPGHSDHPTPDELLHRARRAYKRARYAVEVIEPTAGKGARRLVKRLTKLQDVLGDHQDSLVTADRLKELGKEAHDNGESAFTYGLLHSRQQRAAKQSLTGLRRARRRVARKSARKFLSR